MSTDQTVEQAPADAQTLPLVDISRFRDPAQRERLPRRPAARGARRRLLLRHRARHPAEVTDGVLEAGTAFFALPLEDRLAIENVNSPQFRGYSRVGTERTAGAADQRDQIDVGPSGRAARPACRRTSRTSGLIGPNQWPPGRRRRLKPAVLRWLDEADRVSREVLRALAAALGQPETYFDGWFDDEAHTHVKVVHYPGREQVGVRPGRRRAQGLRLARPPAAGRPRRPAGRGQGRQRGSTPSRCPGPSCSTSARCSRSPPRATCAPPGTASSARRGPRPVQHPGLPRAAPGRRRAAAAAPAGAGRGGGRRRGGPGEPDPRRVRLATSCADGCAAIPRVAERWWPDGRPVRPRLTGAEGLLRAVRSPSSRRGCGAGRPTRSRRPGSRGSPR